MDAARKLHLLTACIALVTMPKQREIEGRPMHIRIESPEMVNRETYIQPKDKIASLKRGKRYSAQTKKVTALLGRLKRQGW